MPDTESLATTLDRVLPYWEKVISPDIKDGKKVLVGRGSDCSGRFCIVGRRACGGGGWLMYTRDVHDYQSGRECKNRLVSMLL